LQPLLQWKRNDYFKICLCICSLRYPACKALAPYLACPAPYYLINGMILENTLLSIKFVFRVYLQFLSETFFVITRIERDMYGDVHVKYPLFLPDFIDTRIFPLIFEKYSNIKYNEDSFSGSRVVHALLLKREDIFYNTDPTHSSVLDRQ
jgi:hypothetical protein